MEAKVNLSIERPAAVPASRPRAARLPWSAVVVAVIIALWIPLLVAPRSGITSDESLYLAEAHNIAWGHGFTYPSGEAITHRAPLYPLALSAALLLNGEDGAYAFSKAVVILNAMLVAILAWRIAGSLAGAIAGFTASASAYLNGLGTTLYLDPIQCTFMLLTVLFLLEAIRSPNVRSFAVAGACTGLAFLAKESAVQWALLGVAAWLAIPSLRSRSGALGALVFTLAFLAAVAPWLAWVYFHDGRLFLIGKVDSATALLLVFGALGFAVWSVAVAQSRSLPPRVESVLRGLAPAAAALLVAGSGCFMLYGLTRYSTWPYPNDYAHGVPAYLRSVAPQVQPYFLIVGAWCWVAWRALRGDEASRLILLSAALFAPFGLFIANRDLQLRDALPLVYLSYVALGIAASALIMKLRAVIDVPYAEPMLYAGLAVAALALAAHEVKTFRSTTSGSSLAEARAESWDNPLSREIATWMSANLPDGAEVLSTRLYFSSIYTETGGRFRIRQMPTVRIDAEPRNAHLLTARSNLFRWEDPDVRPSSPSDQWLYLRRFPGKGYWIGLRQQELLEEIAANRIDYVVLTGDDGAFSGLSYADYFAGHPAFRLLHSARDSSTAQFFVFAVDRDALFLKRHSTAISPTDSAALAEETGLGRDEIAAALGAPLRVTDQERGLSAREELAAIAGVDLGIP